MAALTATDLTVTITDKAIVGSKRFVRGTLVIAGTNTYPTGGIPVGGVGVWGFVRNIVDIRVTGSAGNATEYVYGYDSTNKKLQLFDEEAVAAGGPLLEALSSEVPGARTVQFHAVGW